MMKYRINIYYTTGDTFSSSLAEDLLEPSWENERIAQENVDRIEQHYRYYEEMELAKSPKDKHRIYRKYKKLPWMVDPTTESNRDFDPYFITTKALLLRLDNGIEYQYSTSWTGYFESLNLVELTTEPYRKAIRHYH